MWWGTQPERLPWGREHLTIPRGGCCRPGKKARFHLVLYMLSSSNALIPPMYILDKLYLERSTKRE